MNLMPADSTPETSSITRRRLLSGFGTAVLSGLAGCNGQVPGTGPSQIDAETTVEDARVVWRYPPREGDKEGIGYAAVEIDRVIRREDSRPLLQLSFNSTVGRLASNEPYKGYRPDWFRFRIWPPSSYEGRLGYQFRVEPPGQWEEFSAYYDIQGSARHSIIELQEVNTQGTIIIPAVFDPRMQSLPDQLHCSFTIQASRPGLLGKTVRVSDQASLGFNESDG